MNKVDLEQGFGSQCQQCVTLHADLEVRFFSYMTLQYKSGDVSPRRRLETSRPGAVDVVAPDRRTGKEMFSDWQKRLQQGDRLALL